MKIKIVFAVSILSCMFAFTACSSNNTQEPSTETSESKTESYISSESEKIQESSEESVDANLGNVFNLSEPVSSDDTNINSSEQSTDTEYSNFEYVFDSDTGGISITKYNGNEQIVVIPKTIDGVDVTVIDEGAFAENIYIKSITIPDTICAIMDEAFYRCENLEIVTFSEHSKLAAIFPDAFSITAIDKFTIPENCEEVYDSFGSNIKYLYVLGKDTHFNFTILPSTATVYAYKGSQAEKQLSPLHGYTFVALDEVSQ